MNVKREEMPHHWFELEEIEFIVLGLVSDSHFTSLSSPSFVLIIRSNFTCIRLSSFKESVLVLYKISERIKIVAYTVFFCYANLLEN